MIKGHKSFLWEKVPKELLRGKKIKGERGGGEGGG